MPELKDDVKYLPPEQVNRLIAELNRKRSKVIAELLWRTGARPSELLGLRIVDVLTTQKSVRYFTHKKRSKKRPPRVVPLGEVFFQEFHRYVARETKRRKLRAKDRIFPTTRSTVFAIIKAAGIRAGLDEDLSNPRTLRHSFAVHALNSGVAITVLQRWMGHEDIATTAIYLQFADPDARRQIDKVQFSVPVQ